MTRWLGEAYGKINEAVDMNNSLTMGAGGRQIVCPFRRQEFWKFIGCVLLEVNYGNKGHKLWSELPKYFVNKAPTKLWGDICENNYLYKGMLWSLSSFLYLCLTLKYFILHNFVHLLGISLVNYLSLSLTFFGISLTSFKDFSMFWPCYFFYPLVKGTNNFWKVRGIIGGFNELRR